MKKLPRMNKLEFEQLYSFCRHRRIEPLYDLPTEFFHPSKSQSVIGSFKIDTQLGFHENMKLTQRLIIGKESFEPLIEELPPLGAFLKYHSSKVYHAIYGEKVAASPKTPADDKLQEQQEDEINKTNEAKPGRIRNQPYIRSGGTQQILISCEEEKLIKKTRINGQTH